MFQFRPSRSSTPPRRHPAESLIQSTLSGDASRISAVSVPELAGLTPEDVEIIDQILNRAGPTATTFLMVFKAYNDVLQERGLDPHEVLFYGKLLKLGTLKGRNWQDKWGAIKEQYGYGGGSETSTVGNNRSEAVSVGQRPTIPTGLRVTPRQGAPYPDKGMTDLRPHDNDAETVESEAESSDLIPIPIVRRSRPASQSDMTSNSLGLEFDDHPLLSAPSRTRPLVDIRTHNPPAWDSQTSPVADSFAPSPSVPPSYRAALRAPPVSKQQYDNASHRPKAQAPDRPVPSQVAPRPAASRVPERRGSVASEKEPSSRSNVLVAKGLNRVVPSQTTVAAPFVPRKAVECRGSVVEEEEGPKSRINVPVVKGLNRPVMSQTTVIAPSVSRNAGERRGSVVNEEEAWNRINMLRDEKEADKYREDRLLERYWDVWKTGFEWIITIHQQISEARDELVLRQHVQRWRQKTAARREVYNRVSVLSNKRCLKAALRAWRLRLKEKQQTAWRNSMRMKMKTIRETREAKLRKDAWAKWRQSYRSHLAWQQYNQRLVLRFFERWRDKLAGVQDLESFANEVSRVGEGKALERSWNRWRHGAQLRSIERVVQERVGTRIMDEAMDVWKKQLRDVHTANAYHSFTLMKNTINSWKTAGDRLQIMERKADKHVARQDNVLLRAVSRVWKARERGRLLERVKSVRLLKSVWTVWQGRLADHQRMNELAIRFYLRPNSNVIRSSLTTWKQVYATHQNAQAFALQYHSMHLSSRYLVLWRHLLYRRIGDMKKARLLARYLRVRNAWRTLRAKYSERKIQRSLKEFEMKKVVAVFQEWLERARRERQIRLAEGVIQKLVTTRLLKTTLTHWTNRVIEIKERELEVTQRHEVAVLMSSFNQWKRVRTRLVEGLSLMESYQDVKREENMRRMFYHWLSAARTSRHRRITLQQKEKEFRLNTLAVAWDKWRERYKAESLRPLENGFIMQGHRHDLFRAFTIWQEKTKSLPAIHFDALRIKSKAWRAWRSAMPLAMQARAAREKDKKAVLSRSLEKWVQVYRTKIELKAVARARYLRLAPSANRQPIPVPAPRASAAALPAFNTRTAFPRRATRAEDTDDTDIETRPTRFSGGTRPPTIFPTTRSEASPPRRSRITLPLARDPSPARSTGNWYARERSAAPPRAPASIGDDEGRGRLWQELRGQGRPGPSSVHSRGRPKEPP